MFAALPLPPVLAAPADEPLPATNLRCPVTGCDVSNRRLFHWVAVRGRKYFVYDHRAAVLLKRWPERYLRDDGTLISEP